MKKLFKNRRGTAEIVGTALFLVILLFFFSNVFLWYNSVVRQMTMLMGEKLNSAVGLESTVVRGEPENAPTKTITDGTEKGGDISSTYMCDGDTHDIEEKMETYDIYTTHILSVSYTFNTSIDTIEDRRLTKAVRLSIYAQFIDDEEEGCRIFIWDFVDEVWISTGHTLVKGNRWFNLSFPPDRYIGEEGDVKIKFKSAIESVGSGIVGSQDYYAGTLAVDFLEVSADPFALKLHALGGRDIQLVRIWIVEVETDNHAYIDLEPLNIWVSHGSYRWILFDDETVVHGDGTIKIQYKPPSGEVRFKILTNLGNTATTSYESTSAS